MFQILPPDGTVETVERSMRNLQQTLISSGFNPLGLAGFPTITGTGLSVQGYYTTAVTNLLYFNITLTVTTGNISFSAPAGTYFQLPKPLVLLGSGTVNYPYAVFTMYAPTTGASVGNFSLQNGGTNSRNGILINNTGATITGPAVPILTIQGFYFTGK